MKLQWKGFNKSFKQEGGIPDDYILYYKFSNNLNDETGTYDGINKTGAVSYTTDRFGNSDSAVHFGGGVDYFENLLSFNRTTVSLSLWVKIITKQNGTWFGQFAHPGFDELCFHFVDDGDTNMAIAVGPTISSRFQKTDLPDLFPIGSWHMMTYTYDNGDANFYFDSIFQMNKTLTTTSDDSLNSRIGWYTTDASHGLDGDVDDYLVYDRVLTTDEITKLYNQSN